MGGPSGRIPGNTQVNIHPCEPLASVFPLPRGAMGLGANPHWVGSHGTPLLWGGDTATESRFIVNLLVIC